MNKLTKMVMIGLLAVTILGGSVAWAGRITKMICTAAAVEYNSVDTITIWGQFCDNPELFMGQASGTYTPLSILSAGSNFVTGDLGETPDPNTTHKFIVECRHWRHWKRSCEIDHTFFQASPAFGICCLPDGGVLRTTQEICEDAGLEWRGVERPNEVIQCDPPE